MKNIPRLPLDGNIDLTYRCNNQCVHCWLWDDNQTSIRKAELTIDDINRIVNEARSMGCQAWAISGGEPMLRPDFSEIFDLITKKCVHYSINTNGTLITPKIARLLTRKGNKMVALYGATTEIHDRVTRTPGSFEAMMRGITYLKEAGASFTVQIVPLRMNYHQYNDMVQLASSLSPTYRIGAPWLWLSACGSPIRNCGILEQRLDPGDVLKLDTPNPYSLFHTQFESDEDSYSKNTIGTTSFDDRLFSPCIDSRRDFHIDPYGKMSFCCYIKDPALRYDLKKGNFREAWEEFIPSLKNEVRGGQEYLDNCGSCELRSDCRWCAVYGFLEHGRYSAKVDYLCEVAKKTRQMREDWRSLNIRYYDIAGITVQVNSRLPQGPLFSDNIEKFRVSSHGSDVGSVDLYNSIPLLSTLRLGHQVYQYPPYTIYRNRGVWIYTQFFDNEVGFHPNLLVIASDDFHHLQIFRHKEYFEKEHINSLTTLPTDQVLLGPIFADRNACFLHSSAIKIDEKGFIFIGHSGAGKSTILKLLRGYGEILCDDRNIVRRWPEGFRVHGTWSQGELPDVSPASAPLRAIFYLEQARTNELIPIKDKRDRIGRLLSHLVKPLLTVDWWEKTLDLAGKITVEVPAYRLLFDKSGKIVDLLKQIR